MEINKEKHTTHPAQAQAMARMDVVEVDHAGGSASVPQIEPKQATSVAAHHKSEIKLQ